MIKYFNKVVSNTSDVVSNTGVCFQNRRLVPIELVSNMSDVVSNMGDLASNTGLRFPTLSFGFQLEFSSFEKLVFVLSLCRLEPRQTGYYGSQRFHAEGFEMKNTKQVVRIKASSKSWP